MKDKKEKIESPKSRVKDVKKDTPLEVIEMAIKEIVIDATVNVRSDSVDQDTVDRYTDNFDILPPPSVFEVGLKLYLVDGWHRIAAAGKLKRTVVRIVVVGSGSLDDARDFADRANLGHGLPLTRAQRKEVCVRLHVRHPDYSHRKLAQLLGCTHPTIAAYLGQEAKQSGKKLPGTVVRPNTTGSAASANTPAPVDEGSSNPQHKPPVTTPGEIVPMSTQDELVGYAEQVFIQFAHLDAKLSGQPVSEIARQKLVGLLNLLNQILNKEVAK